MISLQNQKLKLLVLALAIATASSFLVSCGGSKAEANKQKEGAAPAQPAVVQVTTVPAITRQLPRFFEATGSLAADEQTDVAPTVAGKVVGISVDLGSYVKQGSVLVRLDDRDSRIRLEQAEAQVAQAKSAVRQAEARIGLRPGQTFDPSRVAEVRAAQVALELSEKNLRRHERLVESGDVSRSQYDEQKAQRDQLQQQYEVQLTQARQNYAAVQTARAAADAAQTQVTQARKAIADAVVLAPMSGFVSDRPVAVGEYVTTSSKVVTIVRTNPLRMKIDIPEQAIGQVQAGQSVSLTVSANADQSFSGRVARVSPSITTTSRTLTVEAEVENGNNVLKPGQFATVRIMLPESTPAVLVPVRAVRTEAGTSRVFIIKDGRAYQRLVQLGQTEGDLIEIKTGVAADEPVATSSVDQLSDGMVVGQ
jgi:multidrug efflux pump subunit AcrA (membrane-fusion protein)